MSSFTATGYSGETFAADFLEKNGYKILARNYHSRYGEIDIIAADENYIAFIEVKLRKNGSIVSPLESVSKAKRAKIIKTAVDYIVKYGCDLQPRFDIFAIEIKKSGEFISPDFEYLKNAFSADGLELYV